MPSVKSLVFEFLRLPGVNPVLKATRPLLSRFNLRSVDKLPVRGPIRLQLDGKSFLMESDGRDSVASGGYWVGLEAYEGCTLRVFARLARQSAAIVDIGANTGLFSLLAAAVNPDTRILAFEPFPPAADRLDTNIKANAFETIEVIRAAASDRAGTMPLYYNAALRLTQGASLRDWDYVTDKVDVPLVTLDAFLDERRAPRLDLLKVDVEGWEPQVLAGAAETIARDLPEIVSELVKPDCFGPLRGFVQKFGYTAFRLADDGLFPDPGLSESGPTAWNRLLIHPSRLDRIAGLPVIG